MATPFKPQFTNAETHGLPQCFEALNKGSFYLLAFIIFTNCTTPKTENCKGRILDLEMNSFYDPNNKLLNYYNSNTFTEIVDTSQLLRYEKPNRIKHFFASSTIDSRKKKYTYKVKEAIIKTDNYQWDLLALVDNDKKIDNIKYWLKSYDKNRKQIGHLDFAGWSADKEWFFSGRVDCDSKLHMILNDENEHRIFKTDSIGENQLIETKTIQ